MGAGVGGARRADEGTDNSGALRATLKTTQDPPTAAPRCVGARAAALCCPDGRLRAQIGLRTPAGVARSRGELPRRSMAGAREHDFWGPRAAWHAKLRSGKNLASPGPPQIATGPIWVLVGPQRARTRAASGAGGLENSGLVPSWGWACAAPAAGVIGADGDGLCASSREIVLRGAQGSVCGDRARVTTRHLARLHIDGQEDTRTWSLNEAPVVQFLAFRGLRHVCAGSLVGITFERGQRLQICFAQISSRIHTDRFLNDRPA